MSGQDLMTALVGAGLLVLSSRYFTAVCGVLDGQAAHHIAAHHKTHGVLSVAVHCCVHGLDAQLPFWLHLWEALRLYKQFDCQQQRTALLTVLVAFK